MLKNKLDKYFREGNRGGERHKGLKKIEPNRKIIDKHLEKAGHNLNAILDFKNIGYSDWSASASFYALYHCLLALLIKFSCQSRNQTCTFAFIEDLIDKKLISLTKEELKGIFDKNITDDLKHSEKILDIRERMQYFFKTSMEEKELNKLFERTKLLFDKIRIDIEK